MAYSRCAIFLRRYFTQKAHIAGSPREEEELFSYIFNEWKSHLDSARIYPYSVLLSYPNASDPNYVAVQLENGTEADVSAKVEKILNPDQEEDPTVVNPFNAYSLPGTVMVRFSCVSVRVRRFSILLS